MYLQKVRSKKTLGKIFFMAVLKVTDGKIAGSVSQRYGFADPDPYQNGTDPQYGFAGGGSRL
jgi:hypothetical protein